MRSSLLSKKYSSVSCRPKECVFTCVLVLMLAAVSARSQGLASNAATPSTPSAERTSVTSTFDGPAELPRVYIQSTLANTPAPGKTWTVSTASALQSAVTASACGDTIKLQAGATFAGYFSFPKKNCDDQHWIIVRTSAPDSALPLEGTRMTPCYAGVASLPGRPAFHCTSTANVLAKLILTQPFGSGPVRLMPGANHYRFIGLEITRAANAVLISSLVFPNPGSSADHIILDRVWAHGTVHDDTTRAVYLSGLSYVAVVDSYLNDFHCEDKTGQCSDAQAISGGLGNTQDGPFKILNNFLESSGENVYFGGGGATQTPVDIEIRHNHLFKPLTWKPGQSGIVLGNHGHPFIVKNHFELKNGKRVLFEGNLAENVWGGFSQTGFTLLLTPKNQNTPKGSVCPLCQVTDVTVRFSKFSHMGSGFQLANVQTQIGGYPLDGERYSIHDVILEDIDEVTYSGQGQVAQISSSSGGPLLNNVHIEHITAFPAHMLFDIGGYTQKMSNFLFANSIVTTGYSPIWSTGGTTNCAFFDVPLTTLTSCFSSYTFSSNALVAVSSKFPPSVWPKGNTFLPNIAAVGFVNFNNGNGGDYHLTPTSPLKNRGSDGKDLGADVNAVDAATAGAY